MEEKKLDINSIIGFVLIFGILLWMLYNNQPTPEELEAQGKSVEVINIHTINPLDVEAVLKSVAKTGCVVTAEEHQMNGGLGDSIAQTLSLNHPAPLEMVAVNDSFGESGVPEELMKKYGIDAENIVKAVKRVMKRK